MARWRVDSQVLQDKDMKYGTCKQCGGLMPRRAVQESVCQECVDVYSAASVASMVVPWPWGICDVVRGVDAPSDASVTLSIEVIDRGLESTCETI